MLAKMYIHRLNTQEMIMGKKAYSWTNPRKNILNIPNKNFGYPRNLHNVNWKTEAEKPKWNLSDKTWRMNNKLMSINEIQNIWNHVNTGVQVSKLGKDFIRNEIL